MTHAQHDTSSPECRPACAVPIMVGQPNLPVLDELIGLIGEAFEYRWLSNRGRLVRRLEEEVSRMLDARHVIAVVNATTAIQLVARACGLAGEVVVPSFTFSATAQALTWVGLTPVFADVDPATGTLTAATVEPVLSERTSAIVAVNLWGNVCPVDELAELAHRYGVRLIIDSAQALGVTYHGRPVGVFGAAEVFSLHATKIVHACEGGLVVTNDDTIAATVRAMHSFGADASGAVTTIGTNAKMHEISAAMALAVLPSLGEVIEGNRHKYELYRRCLTEVAGVSVREPSAGTGSNYHYVVIEVDASAAGVTRDQMHDQLAARGIYTKPYFAPGCHVLPPYRSAPHIHTPRPLPNTEALAARVLCLPTGPAVTDTEVRTVADAVAAIVSAVGRVA